jgi:hypothetical protein
MNVTAIRDVLLAKTLSQLSLLQPRNVDEIDDEEYERPLRERASANDGECVTDQSNHW